MNNIELFSCYSVPLMQFIKSKGIRYKIVALNPNTMKQFWIYIEDEELSNLLKEWKETKPKI